MARPEDNLRLVQVVIIGWASFLPAAVATALFFASLDPERVAEIATFPTQLTRLAGYTLGFFFFWGMSAAAGALSVFLWLSLDRRKRPDS